MHDDQVPELDIMTIAYKFFLDEFGQLNDEERKYRLSNLDALEMLQTIEMVQKDLAIYKLENHIMVDFLEKNDPKLLVGLRHRRTSILKKLQNQRKQQQDNLQHSSRHSSSKRSISMSIHMASSMGGERRKPIEYKLNYKAKAELAEKATSEVEKRVTDIERNGKIMFSW